MSHSPNAAPAIQFRNVGYRLKDGTTLLRDLNLEVQRGETLVLLGRSGSGKTTTLKLINRLLTQSSGAIYVDSRALDQWNVIRLRRMIGYVIQEVGLFPHFTVARNIGVVPHIEGWPADRIQQRVAEMLQLVGLEPQLASRYPRELSGGQRQRVGVARALAADPAFLLMDEPLRCADPITRADVTRIRCPAAAPGKNGGLVTHDPREACCRHSCSADGNQAS